MHTIHRVQTFSLQYGIYSTVRWQGGQATRYIRHHLAFRAIEALIHYRLLLKASLTKGMKAFQYLQESAAKR